MAWDDFMEAGGLGGIANAYKRAADRQQLMLQQDLYARGYQGMPTDQVEESRGGFGSILEGIGILGHPDPRPLTPYESLIIELGRQGKADREFEQQTRDIQLRGARRGDITKGLSDNLNISNVTGIPNAELLSLNPEYADDVEALLKERKVDKLIERRKNRLEEDERRARLHYYMQGGRGGKPTDPLITSKRGLDVLKGIMDHPLNAKLNTEFKAVVGDPETFGGGELEAAIKSGDVDRISKAMSRYEALRNQIRNMAPQWGLPPEAVDSFLPARFADPNAAYQQNPQESGNRTLSDEEFSKAYEQFLSRANKPAPGFEMNQPNPDPSLKGHQWFGK